jgi:hypothetical protein
VTITFSGLRGTLTAVAAALACTACSAFAQTDAPTVHPAPTQAVSPAAPHDSASTGPAIAKARHRRELRQRFVAGLNDYCRAWYVMQKAANDRYPTSAEDHVRSLLLRSGTQRLLRRLHDLPAPASSRAQLKGFARNEGDLVQAFSDESSEASFTMSAGDNLYNEVLADRHGYAAVLGAKECDGLLPHAQARAAAAATRRWDVTPSAHENCVSLVTSTFSVSTWGATADPLETCLQEFQSRRDSALGPQRAIRVQSVTGVENLQATVTFTQVPDCGCGSLVAKLYFERGRWLLNEVYEQ